MQKFLHKSQHTSAAPWIVNLATFFGPPGGRPSALRAVFLTAAICTALS